MERGRVRAALDKESETEKMAYLLHRVKQRLVVGHTPTGEVFDFSDLGHMSVNKPTYRSSERPRIKCIPAHVTIM